MEETKEMDIIDRLNDEELYVDAIDDAIRIIDSYRHQIANMKDALRKIKSIENIYEGSDFEEIDRARDIATEVLFDLYLE